MKWITWLEPQPHDQDEIEWINEDLPVACGNFKLRKTKITEDCVVISILKTQDNIVAPPIVIQGGSSQNVVDVPHDNQVKDI